VDVAIKFVLVIFAPLTMTTVLTGLNVYSVEYGIIVYVPSSWLVKLKSPFESVVVEAVDALVKFTVDPSRASPVPYTVTDPEML
jgi:hypothetical protein